MMKWVHRFEEHGILPIEGAGVDQTAAFVAMLDFIPLAERRMKQELGIE